MEVSAYLIEAHIFRKINGKLEFLILKRSEKEKYPNIWQPVTGSVNKNEKGFLAALREIKEETGLLPDNFYVAPIVNSFYQYEKDYISFVPVFAAEVNKNSTVKLSEEHSEFLWVSPEKAKELVAWRGQRESIDTICEYFTKPNSTLNFISIKIK